MAKVEIGKLSFFKCEKTLPFKLPLSIFISYPLSKLKDKHYWKGIKMPKHFSFTNGKKDSHSQMDFFCHFKFYHKRKKSLTATTFFADTEKLVFIPPFLQMCIYDRVSQQTLYFCSLPYWPPCEQLSLLFRVTRTNGNVGTCLHYFWQIN